MYCVAKIDGIEYLVVEAFDHENDCPSFDACYLDCVHDGEDFAGWARPLNAVQQTQVMRIANGGEFPEYLGFVNGASLESLSFVPLPAFVRLVEIARLTKEVCNEGWKL